MSIFPENLAIVGNGPLEIGSKNGKLIDSFDKVARFNNYIVNDKFEVDYGKKTDYWISCFWEDVKTRNENYEKVFLPFALYSPSWSRHKAFFNHEAIRKYWDKMVIMPTDYYKDVKQLMRRVIPGCEPSPSTGILFLYWLYREQEGYLNPDHVFGFNFFDRKENQHYFADHKIPPKFFHHTGSVELPVFRYMVEGSHKYD